MWRARVVVVLLRFISYASVVGSVITSVHLVYATSSSLQTARGITIINNNNNNIDNIDNQNISESKNHLAL